MEELIRDLENRYDGYLIFSNSTGVLQALNEQFFAEYYLLKHYLIFEPAETRFYQYAPQSGLWQYVSESWLIEQITQEVRYFLLSREIPDHLATYPFNKKVMLVLKGKCEKRGFFQLPSNGHRVHCANGVLEYNAQNSSWEMRPFSPEDRSRNRSEIVYDPAAQAPKFLEQLLRPAMDEDDIRLLQLYVGQCLLKENISQKFLLITGTAGSGKSSLVNVIERLINPENCTELRAEHLNGRFENSRFVGKTLLTGKDVKAGFLDTRGASMLKALTGKDTLTTEFKHSNETIDITGNFNVIITSNSTLHVRLENDAPAWKRRMLWIQYNNPPPKHPVENFDRLLIETEGSGILNWALDGAKQLLMQKGKIHLSPAQEQRIDELLAETDSLRLFVKEEVKKIPGSSISSRELWQRFCGYCVKHEYDAIPKQRFQRMLPDIMSQVHHVTLRHDIPRHGTTVRGYLNIG